jgi:tellurite resistance protein TerC
MVDSIGSPLLWVGFTALVIFLLVLDLAVFHKQAHEVGAKEALGWSVFWISLALVFNLGVWHWFGKERALEFLTGYLIEKALSVDNLFVFIVIFSYFRVPGAFQHRVLFWGILGALIMRAIFILIGAVLLETFHWIVFVFGGFLIFTGFKIITQQETEVHPERNIMVKLFRRMVPMVTEYDSDHFTVIKDGRRFATPLLLVLLVIETTDVVFAVDSIPAIFAITRDPFIVYTSNIFAILGLRALYFLLARVMNKFHYLKVGLGLVLAFVGVKMLISDHYHMPIWLSLAVIAGVLGLSILASLMWKPMEPPLPGPAHEPFPPEPGKPRSH